MHKLKKVKICLYLQSDVTKKICEYMYLPSYVTKVKICSYLPSDVSKGKICVSLPYDATKCKIC